MLRIDFERQVLKHRGARFCSEPGNMTVANVWVIAVEVVDVEK